MADYHSSNRTTQSAVYILDTQTPLSLQNNVVVKPPKKWKGYMWDTWDLPRDQRRLLLKVDAFVLTFASIGYFLKNIDQTNVNNAFLSGMKEDLSMYGNELVTSKHSLDRLYRSDLRLIQTFRYLYLDSWLRYWTNSM